MPRLKRNELHQFQVNRSKSHENKFQAPVSDGVDRKPKTQQAYFSNASNEVSYFQDHLTYSENNCLPLPRSVKKESLKNHHRKEYSMKPQSQMSTYEGSISEVDYGESSKKNAFEASYPYDEERDLQFQAAHRVKHESHFNRGFVEDERVSENDYALHYQVHHSHERVPGSKMSDQHSFSSSYDSMDDCYERDFDKSCRHKESTINYSSTDVKIKFNKAKPVLIAQSGCNDHMLLPNQADEIEDRCNTFESSSSEFAYNNKSGKYDRIFHDTLKKQKVTQQLDVCSYEADDRAHDINEIAQNPSGSKSKDEISFNTMTMTDAYNLSKLVHAQNENEGLDLPYNLSQSQTVPKEEYVSTTSRKCWSRLCLSQSKHSHVVTGSNFLNRNREDREAILETLPLQKHEDKSFWSKFSDMCTCVKRLFESFELWNTTLKCIEGQHGTGVVSYFVFLRWLIILNLIIFLLCFFLVTLPHAIFPLLPLKDLKIAPNSTILTEEFISRFPDPKNISFKQKHLKNMSAKLDNKDIISNLGSLLDHYFPDEILDLTLSHDKRNFTSAERHSSSRICEDKYKNQVLNRTIGILSSVQDLLQGTGWLESTILFLGYYPPNEISYLGFNYNMPIAIIAALFLSFFVCLCMMIQYSSHGVQERILARKSNYLAYSNILFCSWDYCIEDRKSSIIRHNSILHEIKSTLIEERRRREIKEWSRSKKIKVYLLRIFINILVMSMLCGSYYLIYRVVDFQLRELQMRRLSNHGVNTLLVQYLSPIVITLLNIIVPIIFTNIVKFEMYNTQTQINIALFRIVFLRLSSVFVLVGMLYQQITCQPKDECQAGYEPLCRSPLCWETYVGQQLYKLAVTDFFVYMVMFIIYDLPRDIIVRRFRNKVTQMVGRQVFDLPNQVLSLVYSQTLCWLGIIYSPLIPAITVFKFIILFYVKKVMVLKYCIPAPISYKASRSNAMFMMILMLSFFTLMIIHGYSLSSIQPSPACSPFRFYYVMLEAIPDAISPRSPTFASFLNFLFSGLFFFPAIILMCIAIYYYWTIVVAHRKMVKVLKAQIVLEGRDKQFLLNRLTEVAKGQIHK